MFSDILKKIYVKNMKIPNCKKKRKKRKKEKTLTDKKSTITVINKTFMYSF